MYKKIRSLCRLIMAQWAIKEHHKYKKYSGQHLWRTLYIYSRGPFKSPGPPLYALFKTKNNLLTTLYKVCTISVGHYIFY